MSSQGVLYVMSIGDGKAGDPHPRAGKEYDEIIITYFVIFFAGGQKNQRGSGKSRWYLARRGVIFMSYSTAATRVHQWNMTLCI